MHDRLLRVAGKELWLQLAVAVSATAAVPKLPPKPPAKSRAHVATRPEMVVQNSHGVYHFAFSEDGRRVAVAGWMVDVRDTGSGDLIRRFRAGEEASAAFAEGGRALVFSYVTRGEGPVRSGHLARADLRTGIQREVALAGGGEPGSVMLSGDGAVAVGLRRADRYHGPAVPVVWDALTGAELRQLPQVDSESAKLAVSADGSTAAVESNRRADNRLSSSLAVYEVRTGRLRERLELPEIWVSAVALSADGNLLGAVESGESHSYLRAWDGRSGKELLRSEIRAYSTHHALTFSRDGRWLAGAGDGGRSSENAGLRVCDVATGAVLHDLSGGSGAFQVLAFAPDRKLYTDGYGTDILVWDPLTGHEHRTLRGIPYLPDEITFSPRGDLCLFQVGSEPYLWNLEQGSFPDPDAGFDPIRHPTFSADGRTLASARNYRQLTLFDTQTRTLRDLSAQSPPPPPRFRFAFVRGLAFIPGTHRLATAGGEQTRHLPNYGEIRVWDLDTGAQQLIQHLNTSFQGVVPSTDGKLLYVTEDGGNRVHIYETGGAAVRVLVVPGVGLTLAAAPAPGVVATGGVEEKNGQAKVYLWRPVTGEPAGSFDPALERLERMVTTGDGSLTVSGTDRRGRTRVEKWDTVKCRLRHSSLVPEGASVLGLTADGSLAALALPDGPVGFWDAVADRLLVSLDFGFYREGDGNASAWVMWTPDGYYTGPKEVDRALRWRQDGVLYPAAKWSAVYHRPDLVLKALKGRQRWTR